MTKERAIDLCQAIDQYLCAGNPIWDTAEIHDAMSMAIEALKAQATLDDVSTAYENGYRQGKFEALQWILCSERKPRQQQPVIVTDEGDVLTAYINSLNEWMDFHGNRLKGVTAWLPLPKPYKGDKS